MSSYPAPPKSFSNSFINFLGLAGALACIVSITGSDMPLLKALILCVLAVAVPIFILEMLVLKVYRRPSTGLDFTLGRRRSYNVKRVACKLLGLVTTLAAIAFIYWLLPEYRGSFYSTFQEVALIVTGLLIVLAIPYFLFIDRHMINPHDGYWQMGQVCLGRWREVDFAMLKDHALGWIIKAFFLPLMFVFLGNNISWLMAHPLTTQFGSFPDAFSWWLNLLYYIDLVFAVGGYVLTLRLSDSHIRSSHPFFFGWFITLFCYPPFWNLLSPLYVSYDDNVDWLGWLANYPSLAVLWGTAILALTAIYAWATISFGNRFSNLTHRGILTNGPYRFTKHPAYVFKNASWWLISVPFIPATGWGDALRNCCMLLVLNAIYYIRARMEEKHLSQDPVYVEYALWIEKHGIFRQVGNLLPFLKYRAPSLPVSA